jgi:hypothetical protein
MRRRGTSPQRIRDTRAFLSAVWKMSPHKTRFLQLRSRLGGRVGCRREHRIDFGVDGGRICKDMRLMLSERATLTILGLTVGFVSLLTMTLSALALP